MLFFLGISFKKSIIELCGDGGTADTHASGACAPSGVRVQVPFSASWKGGPARYGTGLEIRQVDFLHARVQIPSFPSIIQKDMSFISHVFSIIWSRLLEVRQPNGRNLLSQGLLLVQMVANRLLGSQLLVWLWFLRSCQSDWSSCSKAFCDGGQS